VATAYSWRMGAEGQYGQKIALVAGATGLVGSALLRQLMNCQDYSRIHAITRRPLLLDHPRLANRILPLEETRAKLAGLRCQDAFCCIGSTRSKAGSDDERRRVDLDLVLSFARAAQSFGVTRFVVLSSAGANPTSSNAYLRTKGEMELALRELRFASLDILQPGLIMGLRRELRPLELAAMVFMPLVNPLLRGSHARWRGISAVDLGAAMLGAARSQRRGMYVYSGENLRALATAGSKSSG
jgi:uncharacterized protein YbjT (DUF2867 family)